MARGNYFKEFECDLIRAGLQLGKKAPTIAKHLGRTKQGVQGQIKKMQRNGSIDQIASDIVLQEYLEKANR